LRALAFRAAKVEKVQRNPNWSAQAITNQLLQLARVADGKASRPWKNGVLMTEDRLEFSTAST